MTARALVLEAPRRLVESDFDVPVVADDDAVLRVEACGLCGTDYELYTGDIDLGYHGFIPGHETVGVIEAIGPVAARTWGVAAGDRVAVYTRPVCRACDHCRRGDLANCAAFGPGQVREFYGLTPIDKAPALWGGYATHHYLRPESLVLPVPAGVDPEHATLFNALAAGVTWAVDLPATGPGDVVAVLGPGIRGIAAVVAAKAAGAGFIMVTGKGAADRERLAVARRLGADVVIDVTEADPVDVLREAVGGLADVVVEVTANAPAAAVQAVELAGRQGRAVLAGAGRGRDTATLPLQPITARGIRVIGATGVGPEAQARALALLGQGVLEPGVVMARSAGFAGLGDLLATMAGEGTEPPPLHGVFVPDGPGD